MVLTWYPDTRMGTGYVLCISSYVTWATRRVKSWVCKFHWYKSIPKFQVQNPLTQIQKIKIENSWNKIWFRKSSNCWVPLKKFPGIRSKSGEFLSGCLIRRFGAFCSKKFHYVHIHCFKFAIPHYPCNVLGRNPTSRLILVEPGKLITILNYAYSWAGTVPLALSSNFFPLQGEGPGSPPAKAPKLVGPSYFFLPFFPEGKRCCFSTVLAKKFQTGPLTEECNCILVLLFALVTKFPVHQRQLYSFKMVVKLR
jgi:hypothetical protein